MNLPPFLFCAEVHDENNCQGPDGALRGYVLPDHPDSSKRAQIYKDGVSICKEKIWGNTHQSFHCRSAVMGLVLSRIYICICIDYFKKK